MLSKREHGKEYEKRIALINKIWKSSLGFSLPISLLN